MSPSIRTSKGRRLLGLIAFGAIALANAQPPGPVVQTPPPPVATPRGAGAPVGGNATHGKALYQSCSSCHSIDENDIGPKHRGVIGRKAGTVPDYSYSKALKASGIVWNAVTLDRWLTNPSAMVPGTKMYFLLADPQDRADVIAYLAELE